MNNAILSIIIPTYKRTTALINNLRTTEQILIAIKEISNVEIIISADGSPSDHIATVRDFCHSSQMKIRFYVHDINLGLSKNELFLIEKVETKFALLLGEDDFLNSDLLSLELKYIRESDSSGVSTIIPNYYGVDENKKKIRRPKRPIRADKIHAERALNELYKANQMSGLVFCVSGLYDSYKKNAPENVYPHLYFVGYSMLLGKTVEITRFPFMNTYIKQKSFEYTYDGLTDQIIKIYLSLPYSENERTDGIVEFLKKDYIRYCNAYTWAHPHKFLAKINNEYEKIGHTFAQTAKKTFIRSYLLIPYEVCRHYIVRIFK